MPQEALLRLKSLSLPSNYPEPDIIRLINRKAFEGCIANEIRCAIMSILARGVSSAAEIANALNISRTAIYRHLHVLERNGFIVYRNGGFYVGARMFLVYDLSIDENNNLIKINVYTDKGGFVDGKLGFVFVKGDRCRCEICIVRDECLRAVKDLARKLDIKIRSEVPIEGFREIVTEMIRRDVANLIRNGYLIVKIPEEEVEES
ncbi:transcriptional regulator, ArsR family [Ignisphaera aggregans DSM 17230]|uniref:Transcriptional regulator, ArsR family n=1 Tax=Ignisphaera aggregans (strain DSM 17230 / JCM 13409 / AQ1.S1) TaxID=583356 RepID=E0STT8_IGNAA|nr:transcriptional regulator, ArsR family [Ignisphaera aggregans DSM 17230]